MNRKAWSYAALIASLAVNAGVLAVFGLERYRVYRAEQRVVRTWVKDRAALKEMDRMFEASRVRRDALWDEEIGARRELGRLGLEPDPDSAAVDAVLARLEDISRRQWQEWVDVSRAFGRLVRTEVYNRWVTTEMKWADSVAASDSATGLRGQR